VSFRTSCRNGEPAPEWLTSAIFEETKKVDTIRKVKMQDLDLSQVGTRHVGEDLSVEVIDPVDDYLKLMKEVFDFNLLKQFVSRSDVRIKYDALHAVTGIYARRLLCEELGASSDAVINDKPLPDFNGGHPDPNLTYASELVETMYADDAPFLGAASDGDGDRNMILGSSFFVSPSDSLAVLARNAHECIPWFYNSGLKAAARSMPTAAAVDKVCEEKGVTCYETPTGWKFFGNLMDDGRINICGEESFGTGSDHVREKDGLWALLAWLSVLAHRNKDVPEGGTLVRPADVVEDLWKAHGRTFFCRHDYEGVDVDGANKMLEALRELKESSAKGSEIGGLELDWADEFEYSDPVDGSSVSKQGLRFNFEDGSRVVFRLSGTGAEGATVRIYTERHSTDEREYGQDSREALKATIEAAQAFSDLKGYTGRESPTVVT
jgi:phosphoglucomutase